MKRFICILISALFFTSPVFADDEIPEDIVKISGIEIIGNIPAAAKPIELNPAEGYPLSVQNVNNGLDAEYEFYSQLDSNEKLLYNTYLSNIEKMKNGTEQVGDFISVNVDTGLDLDTALQNAISIAGTNTGRALLALWYDKPQYFWYDINKMYINFYYYQSGSYNSQTGTFLIKPVISPNTLAGYENYYPDSYSTQEEVEADYEKLVNCKDSIISGIDNTGSDFEKIKYFNDWLCDHNTYNKTDEVTRMRYIIPSAMIYGPEGEDTEKNPVCQGYAFALKYLCDESGIPCTVTISSTHMWNLIKLEGKWYTVDTTWNDNYKDAYANAGKTDTNLVCYNWLAIGSDRVTAIDQNSSHVINVQMNFNSLEPTTATLLEDLGMVSYYLADANNDYTISRADIATLLKNACGLCTVTKDTNNDGEIDLRDGISLAKLLLK